LHEGNAFLLAGENKLPLDHLTGDGLMEIERSGNRIVGFQILEAGFLKGPVRRGVECMGLAEQRLDGR
jgi:hypothetical protein